MLNILDQWEKTNRAMISARENDLWDDVKW
jgi:hypothetical protein